MRPDEHKKKKNAQYKKKHGVQGKDAQPSDLKSKGDKKTKFDRSTTDAKTNTKETVKVDVESKQSQNAENEESSNAWGFSRRTVESNWDRYQPIEDGSDEEKATDFNVLLSFAGSTSSYMKLQAEQEWEEEETDLSALSIDCKRLAESLDQLPFVEKYKLDQLNIEPTLLELIASIDEEDVAGYDNVSGKILLWSETTQDMGFDFMTSSKKEPSTGRNNMEQNAMGNTDSESDSIVKRGDALTGEEKCQTDGSKDEFEEIPSTRALGTIPNAVGDDEVRNGSVESSTYGDGHQDDVDSQADNFESQKEVNGATIMVESSLEDDLDDLLNLSKTDHFITSPPSLVPDNGKDMINDSIGKPVSSETDNLEDWLDSIL